MKHSDLCEDCSEKDTCLKKCKEAIKFDKEDRSDYYNYNYENKGIAPAWSGSRQSGGINKFK